MNVLIISARADYGGGPEHIYQLIKNSSKDIEYFIACPKEEPYWNLYFKIVGDKIYEIPHRKISLLHLYKLLNLIKSNNIQLIHTHGKGAGIYGRILSMIIHLPLIHTPHGIHVGQYNYIIKMIYHFYENIMSRLTNTIIYVSESEKKQALQQHLWSNISSVIINNGVENNKIDNILDSRKQTRNNININSQKFIIATITRFDFQKNMWEAYEIAKTCKDYVFLFIGDGPEKEKIESRARKEGNKNIIFTGFTKTPKQYLEASDIYLSTSRWEGMPLGVLEAMSLGLPVVATNVTGNNEAVLNGETGFLYPLGDIGKAISILNTIEKDGKLYKELSRKSLMRQRSKYSVGIMVDKTQDLYRKVLYG